MEIITPYCEYCKDNIITIDGCSQIKCNCDKVKQNIEYLKTIPEKSLGNFEIDDDEDKKKAYLKTCDFATNNKHWLMFLGMRDYFKELAIACFRVIGLFGKNILCVDWVKDNIKEVPDSEVLLILNYREIDDNSPVLLKKILEGRKDKKTIFTSKYSIEVFRELDAELADLIEQTTKGDYINYLIDL